MKVNSSILASMNKEDVFIVNWKVPLMKNRFFININPSVPVVQCQHCNMFFHEEDFEFEVLKEGCCPFCRADPSLAKERVWQL